MKAGKRAGAQGDQPFQPLYRILLEVPRTDRLRLIPLRKLVSGRAFGNGPMLRMSDGRFQRGDGRLIDALFESTRQWTVSFHFNKGLAGAPADALSATRDTPMNPAVLNAFALAIIAGEGAPAFPGMSGHEPDEAKGRRYAARIAQAAQTLRTVVPDAGTYLSESNFFEANWQRANWGSNYAPLVAVKRKYDPDGLFFVHHGVNSDAWSADGFLRVKDANS
ncbi:BBE domain-containing protein [Paraburkholderia sediminicola]|uniref:BBE domain-containing protein n=1 Tax=Paraburkholderia sediminicola TaxID=458836 RepID=UPI0038B838A1